MKVLVAFVALATLSLPAVGARAQVADNEVVVRDTSFRPPDLQIDPGDTVTWRVEQDDHTITAEDGAFDFPVDRGDVETHTFDREGTFRYFCRIHASMRGVVRVGDGCAGECDRVCRDCERPTRTVPSLEFPTIESALVGASARTLVAVRPGRYDIATTLVISSPGVELRGVKRSGAPAAPGEVVLRGRFGTEVGIRIATKNASTFAPAVIRNLTLTGFMVAGVDVEGSDHFEIIDVRAIDNGSYGIRAIASSSGRIARISAQGHRSAGISIESCDACGILIEGARASGNFLGLQTLDSTGIVVRRSRFHANANGAVLRSSSLQRDHGGVHLYGNKIDASGHPEAPAPSVFDVDLGALPAGAGIWVQGGAHDIVEANVVSDNHYGIVVTASSRFSRDHRVRENDLSGNVVDLAWDGAGDGVCFTGNRVTTSEPGGIQDLYPCDRPVGAGIPHPKVVADLASFAWRTYYCRQIDDRVCP